MKQITKTPHETIEQFTYRPKQHSTLICASLWQPVHMAIWAPPTANCIRIFTALGKHRRATRFHTRRFFANRVDSLDHVCIIEQRRYEDPGAQHAAAHSHAEASERQLSRRWHLLNSITWQEWFFDPISWLMQGSTTP